MCETDTDTTLEDADIAALGYIKDGNTGWDNSYGFYSALSNFTGAVTDTKYCTYDATSGEINCTSDGGSTDTNESTRFNVLVGTDCGGTDKVVGVNATGGVKCAADVDTDTDTDTYTNETQVDTWVGNNGYLTSYIDQYTNQTQVSLWISSEGYYNSESNLTALLDDNYADISVVDTNTYNSTQDMLNAVNNTRLNASLFTSINCSQIVFDTGIENTDICDGVDASAAGGGNSTEEIRIAINNSGSYNMSLSTPTITSYLDLAEQSSAPATPNANTLRLYTLNDNGFTRYYYIDELGVSRTFMDDEIIVKNVRGSTIAKNRFVYATGNEDNATTIDLAKADTTATMPAIGVTMESIANGSFGRVLQTGQILNVDTTSLSLGTIYVSAETAGIPTNTAPITPNLTQEMGTVLVVDNTVGRIQIISRALTGDEYGTINDFKVAGNITGELNCSNIRFNNGLGSAAICDGDDAVGGATDTRWSINYTEFINVSNMLQLNHSYLASLYEDSLSDTNESTRFNALTGTDCAGTAKMTGINASGGIVCAIDVDTDTDSYLNDTYIASLGYIKTYIDSYTNETQVDLWVSNDGYYNAESNLTGLLDDNYVDVTGDTMTGHLYMNANISMQTTNTDASLVINSSNAFKFYYPTGTRWFELSMSGSATTAPLVFDTNSAYTFRTDSIDRVSIGELGVLNVSSNIIQGDNDKHCFGDGEDACMYWNGTAFIID